MAAKLDVPRFYDRLGKIHSHFVKHRSGSAYGGATCLSLNRGPLNDENIFLKSIVVQQYLFGYELPDTILLLTESGNCFILATKRKCEFLQPAVDKAPKDSPIQNLNLVMRSKSANLSDLYDQLLQDAELKEKDKVGCFLKERVINGKKDAQSSNGDKQNMLAEWERKLESAKMECVDCSAGISLVMAVKEDSEVDLMRKSSVLSNKILKHGLVPRIEEVIDSELSVTHEQLSNEVEGMIEDPSKVKLNIPKEHVQSCYFPILQSGGEYDIKISAQSSDKTLKYDIIMASLGSRYQLYCSNISRTFLVDPPKKVSDTYETLLNTQLACLQVMIPGNPLKAVYSAAVRSLRSAGRDDLVERLPKNLGFGIGLDFRDPALVLTGKNPAIFRQGMVFTLSVGFSDVELTDEDKSAVSSKSAVKSLDKFSVLVADTISITSDKAEFLTKHSKDLSDISYTINEEGDDASSTNEADGDEAYARALSKEPDNIVNGQRVSARLASSTKAEATEGAAEREKRQMEIMARKNEQRIREQARASAKNKNKGDETAAAEELMAYANTKSYPDYVLPNQVKVDMSRECVILPIGGNPIPFHISTIKNVVLPDPDQNAFYLRINFYTAGTTLGKDTPVNTGKLIQKYAPYATFIRELTFRSLDSHSLTQAFRQISELRKRVRQRELQEQEEANLVKQEKLVQTRTERVPRLSDLTMRPVFAGRKTQGNLEAHSNGIRFRSSRGEILDIMYNNIKHAIFQPCESEIMVLIHFHLKNPIMVGKKRQRDVQFFTEVIDASLQVDGSRRSMYDPDEVDDEQRERQLRKKLNDAFKDFCRKVEAAAKKNGYSLEFDIPYRDLGFQGTPHKEMVFVQPTLSCLVNLTETPFFCVDLSEVDHVHFERVTFMSKAIDMVLVPKDFTKQPGRVDMIVSADKDSIQEWLTDMEISYTEGPMNLNWKQIMSTVAGDERFYHDTHEDEVTPKDAGWEFLRIYGKESDSEGSGSDLDSEFSEGKEEDESSEEEEEEESAFDSESSEESDYDADEDLEEQGMDWDEMEREAAADDRRKRQQRDDDGGDARARIPKNKRARTQSRPSGAGRRRR